MKEPTLTDFLAKGNKDLPLEERAKKFSEEMKPLTEKWGVIPYPVLGTNEQAIAATLVLKDLWTKPEENVEKN